MQVQALIESLLYEEEGTELDFKRDQYPFADAEDRLKAELLKDILAFANSWRRADAYILVGVQEVKGGRSIVKGIDIHLDDARLQQFVNSKTNRPVEFSYTALEFEGKQIALISIPRQERPVFLLKDFGLLLKHQVYLRRGSSTAIALPDEIARMGMFADDSATRCPLLTASLVYGEGNESSETNVQVETSPILVPSKDVIPSFAYPDVTVLGGLSIRSISPANPGYYRELAEYIWFRSTLRPFRLSVTNSGSAVAMDVKLVIDAQDPERNFELVHQSNRPERPKKDLLASARLSPKVNMPQHDVVCTYMRDRWRITVTLGKIQAKDTVVSREAIFIGTHKSGTLKLEANIFSDDLPAPAQGVFTISYKANPRELTVSELTSEHLAS